VTLFNEQSPPSLNSRCPVQLGPIAWITAAWSNRLDYCCGGLDEGRNHQIMHVVGLHTHTPTHAHGYIRLNKRLHHPLERPAAEHH
jgi:hypothetical protein